MNQDKNGILMYDHITVMQITQRLGAMKDSSKWDAPKSYKKQKVQNQNGKTADEKNSAKMVRV